jgi:DNA-binding FadR family transcriptional regulator
MDKGYLSRDGLTDQVITRIQERIWSGDIVPGSLLPTQKELASQFGVGLSTIREAIRALAHIGLVEVIPGKGTKILPDALRILTNEKGLQAALSTVNLEEFYEARGVIEIALTAFAAERATEENLQKLSDLLAEMELADKDNDLDRFSIADIQFHLTVAQASKNSVLEKMYLLTLNIMAHMIEVYNKLPGGAANTLKYHRQIFEGIASGDTNLTQNASDPKKYRENLPQE